MNFNIDIAIVSAFLLLTLFVGLGHGQKVQSIKDYALGGRNFSTGALVATITATWVSGSGFFIVLSKTYTNGLYYFFASSCMAIQLLIIAFIFAPKMKNFLGDTSIAESIGKIYGRRIRFITALTGTLGAVGAIAVQFKAFGTLLSYFSTMTPSVAVIIAGCIVIAYSSSGGIKAVTVTDILQFVTFGFAIPFVGIIIWNHLFDQNLSVISSLSQEKFNYQELFNMQNLEFWSMLPLVIYFIMPGMEPAFCQRIIIGSDTKQVKKAFFISAVCLVFIKLSIAWISFLAFTATPDIEANRLLGYIIDNYTVVGMKALVIIGVIAMAMSTADSYINSSSVLFANDICKPFGFGVGKELFFSRMFAVFLGIAGIVLALSKQDLLSMILIASSLYMPIVSAPLILTILGFRSTEKSVIIGMCAGGMTVFFWDSFSIGANSIVISVFVNALFMVGSHYILYQDGGWVDTGHSFFKSIKDYVRDSFYSIFSVNFNKKLKKIAPRTDADYVSLGIYFLLYTIITIYSTQNNLLHTHNAFVLAVYQIMLITGTIMLMFPIWPKTISDTMKMKFIQMLWFVSIIYMLVLFNTFFVMATDFSQLQFSIFSINLIVSALLIGWKLAIMIIPIGFYIAKLFFNLFFGEYIISAELISPDFILVCAAMLTCIVLIIFLKPKQEYQEDTEAKVDTLEGELEGLDDIILNLKKQEGEYTKQIADLNQAVTHYSERVTDQAKEIERLGATAQKILNNVNHELRLPVGNVMNFSQMICEGLDKYTPDQLKDLSDEVYKNSTRLSSMILNMLDLAMLDVRKINLNKSTENFSELVRDRVKICRNMYLQGKPIKFKLTIEPEILIPIDSNYIKQVVDNLTINAINFSQKGLIEVEVRRQGDKAVMMMRDEGIGIPKQELFDIFDPFRMGSNTATKAEGRGVGLALCKSAVEAHDGIITAESPEGKGAVFYVVLPRENA